jgi:hypothetical protein
MHAEPISFSLSCLDGIHLSFPLNSSLQPVAQTQTSRTVFSSHDCSFNHQNGINVRMYFAVTGWYCLTSPQAQKPCGWAWLQLRQMRPRGMKGQLLSPRFSRVTLLPAGLACWLPLSSITKACLCYLLGWYPLSILPFRRPRAFIPPGSSHSTLLQVTTTRGAQNDSHQT